MKVKIHMNRIKIFFIVTYNIFRFSIKKILKNRIYTRGINIISPIACIEMGRNAKLTIGNKVHIDRNTYMGIRNDSVINIGDGVYINRNCVIVSYDGITLDSGVQIGPNVCIYDHDHDLNMRGNIVSQRVHIKKNAWISAGVIILKGVTIGENSVIAAGCVVTKDVPDNTIMIQKKNDTLISKKTKNKK